MCGRRVYEGSLTCHHLRCSVARRMQRRKIVRRELKRCDPGKTVVLSGLWDRKVHVALCNGDLEREDESLEALSAHPDVRRFIESVRDKPQGRF